MSKLRHLVVSVSGHGFGHVAQTAPILNALHQRCPQLRITVRSSAPESHLRSRIHAPFDYLNSTGDIGMMMSSALAVDVEKSRSAYHAFHADWDARVTEEAHLLRSLGADRVFSNVGYLPLAGAQRAGIPNVALCSLNWADIYAHYCHDRPEAPEIQITYDNRTWAITNVSSRPVNLEGLEFEGGGTTLPITQWKTFVDVPLRSFSSGSCLQSWSWNESGQLPQPGPCSNRWSVLTLSPSRLFWLRGFNVYRNGTLVAACAAGAGQCAVDLP